MERYCTMLLEQLLHKAHSVEHKMQKATHETGKAIAELENRRIERRKAAVGGKTAGPKEPALFKTQLCRNQVMYGQCKFGNGCWFAHSKEEMRDSSSSSHSHSLKSGGGGFGSSSGGGGRSQASSSYFTVY